ncbi:MAG: putative E3 ubiquitin-protein ligase Itchy [Streblomastix strix]|uniref:HECT-type E3 ubiquitin transferase n=1 Tax=Streblomastix strix TaxID=222440 RepID=A0A5J4W614_9EUKA|nr:MAG: putative E3 ubiquitin-protein ligase Itchy [Streblomastix strix]
MNVKDRQIRSLPVEVRFERESGIDAGGMGRDWFSNLMNEATSTRTRLFTCRPQNEYRYSIARTKVSMDPSDLQLYKFIGLVLSKVLLQSVTIPTLFDKLIYKTLLGKPAQLQDIFSIDPELGTQLMQIAYKDPIVRTIELVPNGSNVPLTNYNKDAYIILRIQRRLTIGIQAQLEQMREGFQHLVSRHFIEQQELEAEDIELLLYGHTDIDVQDWQESTIVEPSSDTNSYLINWFWDIVRTDFTDQKRRQLLRFATGSPAPPQEGFAFLLGQNSNRLTPFKIQIFQFQDENMLPISHTCFNKIDLPRYRSKEQLKMKLILAIEQTNDGILNA